MRSALWIVLAGTLAAATAGRAQENTAAPPPTKGKLSGEVYYDYFYNVQQADSTKKDLQGFQIRRIYFTYDHMIASSFDARVRFEADSKELTTPGGKITTFMKEAYVKWKNIFQGSDLIAGLSPTPTWYVSEDAWAYRSLEKTIMDLRGIASRTDIGVDLKGKITDDGLANYFVKIGNNSGQAPEANKYKRYYGLLHLKPGSQFQATAYADYDAEAKRFDPFDSQTKDNSRWTFAGFLNYKEENQYSIGLELFERIAQNNFSTGGALQNLNTFGISAFAWGEVADGLRLVGRFDLYDPNTSADNDGVSFFLGALDYMPVPEVHLMPNIWVQTYQASGLNSDVVARATVAYFYK